MREIRQQMIYLLCVDILTNSVINITQYYICQQGLKQTKSKSDCHSIFIRDAIYGGYCVLLKHIPI